MKILAFAGSTRKESLNKKLVKVAAEGAREAGAEVTVLDLADFPMPLYDGDLEAEHGLPENARRLKALMKEHDGFLLSVPEYNGSFPAVFKNVLDWASRREGDEPPLAAYAGKAAALMAASPGWRGGTRSLHHTRDLLHNLGLIVSPRMETVAGAHKVFDDQGRITDEGRERAAKQVGADLAALLKRLRS